MTAEKNKIQSVGLVANITCTAGNTGTENAADVHIFDDDVTVIGIILEGFIYGTAEYDSGKVEVTADVGPIGQVTVDGHMAGIRVSVSGRSVTVGAGVTEVVSGEPIQRLVYMLPEPYGIDYDRNTGIYINCGWSNTMANNHSAQMSAIVLYKER